MKMTRTLIASALLAFSSAASATNPIVFHLSDPPMARINTRDVDVRTVEGRRTVTRRIEIAARQVCANAESDGGPPTPMAQYDRCYSLAVARGVAQLKTLSSL